MRRLGASSIALQVVDEFNPTRHLITRKSRTDKILSLGKQFIVAFNPCSQHHESFDDFSARRVGHPDDRDILDRRVARQW